MGRRCRVFFFRFIFKQNFFDLHSRVMFVRKHIGKQNSQCFAAVGTTKSRYVKPLFFPFSMICLARFPCLCSLLPHNGQTFGMGKFLPFGSRIDMFLGVPRCLDFLMWEEGFGGLSFLPLL